MPLVGISQRFLGISALSREAVVGAHEHFPNQTREIGSALEGVRRIGDHFVLVYVRAGRFRRFRNS